MAHGVTVRAPCRLHFGLFSFGHTDRPQFGGVGAMIDPPAVEVTITAATQFAAHGSLSSRVERYAAALVKAWSLSDLPACQITVDAPPDHVGLGVGTQLGLAVAAGLRQFLNLKNLPIEELAASVGRGVRSAVGTYGFQNGGLIMDAGKIGGEKIGKLWRRIMLPREWRFVLVRPADSRGLAGESERDAFAKLPPVLTEVTDELWRITENELLPAIDRSDCAAFGEAVYQFGRMAGECFAPVQGGPFANPDVARLIDLLRRRGITGVGQSSWGPTVFAVVDGEAAAQSLVDWLRAQDFAAEHTISVARPNNIGATLREL